MTASCARCSALRRTEADMNAPFNPSEISRRALIKGGALTIAFAMSGTTSAMVDVAAAQSAPTRNLDPNNVDAFFSIGADGRVTVYCGKVDLGTGLRAAIPQMAAEELGVDIAQIDLITGDTALTPDQGPTGGSSGIMRGGVQIRQAAATARQALLQLASSKLNVPATDLDIAHGVVSPKAGGTGLSFADLLTDRKFDLKVDPKAPQKDPRTYQLVGKPLPRPDVPAKCTGTFPYVHNFTLPGMLHGRTIRPPAIGATLVSVDDSGLKDLKGVRVVRIKDFLGVVAEDEWTCIRAQRALKAQWSEWSGLPEQGRLADVVRTMEISHVQTLPVKAPTTTAAAGAKSLKATYFWPMQSHA